MEVTRDWGALGRKGGAQRAWGTDGGVEGAGHDRLSYPSPDRWSQEDMLTLLECMKNNLPSNDSSKFKTTESHMDWEKVAFKDFSGDMCKLKWVEISNEVTGTPLSLPDT